MAKINGAAADPHIVEMFTRHLMRSFMEFAIEYPGDVDYIDGIMAAHNFHVRVVENAVEESGVEVWRDVALETFRERLACPGGWDTAVGKG
ncbi:MAG: hypothetical protein OCU12_07775 [Methanophagales archaeon]|nr:hypothetical protein [Methanophagales archaeon]